MQIKPNRNYVTQAGYVVKIGEQLRSKNTLPCDDLFSPSNLRWDSDGSISYISPNWREKLRIVAELPIEIPTLPEGYRWKDGFIQWRNPLKGEQFTTYGRPVLAQDNNVIFSHFIIESAAGGKEIVMNPVVKKSASLIGGLMKKTANYWLVEPALNIARPIIKSVRYATFLTVVAGSVYAFYHPDKVKDLAWKCLPKVTIEAPEILKPKV